MLFGESVLEPGILSTEMIDYQHDDAVVKTTIELFTSLITSIDTHNLKSTHEMFDNKEARNIIKQIDQTISKRFGISFKHISTTSNNYGVFTSPPKNFNVLIPGIKENFKATKKWLDAMNKPRENVRTKDEIRRYDGNEVDVLTHWQESMDAIEKTLGSSSVTVDLKKAHISGLPSSYVGFIMGDFYFLFKNLEINADEITAILFHEIGHMFTHLEYSYRTVRNTSVLIDSLRENITKKNMSFKKALLLSYKKATGDDASDLKNSNTVNATLTVVNRYIKSHNYLAETKVAYTDSEQLADQFSGRFGLSESLGNGLVKFKSYIAFQTGMSTAGVVTYYISLMYITGILVTASASGAFFFAAGVIALLYGIVFLGSAIVGVATDGATVQEETYDDFRRRIERIRSEMMRQLKNSDLSNKDLKALIASIDSLSSTLKDIPADDVSIIDNFIRKNMRGGRIHNEMVKTEELIEDLDANDLYLASNKLKLIK